MSTAELLLLQRCGRSKPDVDKLIAIAVRNGMEGLPTSPCATSTPAVRQARYTVPMAVHRRRSTFKTSVLVVLSLVFSQMALASYVCPAQVPTPAVMEMAPGMPCDGMDAAEPALCHQHCADPGQVAQPAQVVAPSLPAIVQVLFAPMVLRALDAVAVPPTSSAEAQPPPDPIFLATLRLRV